MNTFHKHACIQLLFLMRLAPYPYNLFNTLLSATHISLRTFACATALSLLKLLIHVYIGTKLSSFSAHFSSEVQESDENESHSSGPPLDVVKMSMGITGVIIAVGVVVYVWLVARRMVKEVEDEDVYDCEYECCDSEGEERGGRDVDSRSNVCVEKDGEFERHASDNIDPFNQVAVTDESPQSILFNSVDHRRRNSRCQTKSLICGHKRMIGFADNTLGDECDSIPDSAESVDDENINSANFSEMDDDNETDGLMQSIATSISERHSGPVQRKLSKPVIDVEL
jgi:hypothetical protein